MNNITQNEWYLINQIVSNIYRSDSTNILEDLCRNLKELLVFDKSFSNLSSNKKFTNHYFHYQSIDIDQETLDKYINYYVDIDYAAWYTVQPYATVYKDTELIVEEKRITSMFFNDWLKPMNVFYGCGTCIAHNEIIYGNFSLFRSKEKGDFSEKDLEILNVVNSHLCQRFSQLYPGGINYASISKSLDAFQSKYNLTTKEYEIIKLIKQGTEVNNLSTALFISENTVKKHLSNIYSKLNVNNRSQFIKLIESS